jgi:hypothetical protein
VIFPGCLRRDDGPKCASGDCHISQHYKLLLKLFLGCLRAPGILFLEDDLEIAPDFFSYFEATVPLMANDNSIYCVSAWNDHGQRGRVNDNTALYRTDVMPGLGWYLNAKIGMELARKWPPTNWDDWMRLPAIKAGRSCIYPEVSSSQHEPLRDTQRLVHLTNVGVAPNDKLLHIHMQGKGLLRSNTLTVSPGSPHPKSDL